MVGFSLGRLVEGALNLFDVFDPIVEPYRRFHEQLPPKMQQTVTAFIFILPFGILYAIFTILPIFQTFWISLHRWEIMGTNIRYIGLRNFERLLTRDTQFHQAFEQTILFVALSIPIIFVGLCFALMLNRPVKGIGIFRTIFYLPNIMAVTVIGLIWARVFASSSRGLLNAVLDSVNLDIIPFLDKGDLATLVVAFTTLMVDCRFQHVDLFWRACKISRKRSMTPPKSTAPIPRSNFVISRCPDCGVPSPSYPSCK